MRRGFAPEVFFFFLHSDSGFLSDRYFFSGVATSDGFSCSGKKKKKPDISILARYLLFLYYGRKTVVFRNDKRPALFTYILRHYLTNSTGNP